MPSNASCIAWADRHIGTNSPSREPHSRRRRGTGFFTAKPYDSGSLRKKVLKAAALRAKIQARIGWHTFRHSYRAWLDETGAFLGVQQKLMRHANISTTMNVYGGAFMESKRKANTSVVQRVLLQDHTK
jgi:integrase